MLRDTDGSKCFPLYGYSGIIGDTDSSLINTQGSGGPKVLSWIMHNISCMISAAKVAANKFIEIIYL